MNRLSKILFGTAAALTPGLVGDYYFNQYIERKDFREAYQQSLIEADTNHDGKLSEVEIFEFRKNLFANTGMQIIKSRILYEDGKEVPMGEATKLLKDYNLKKD